MPKSLNPDQIAMLDKEVAKLDKKLDNKDMEKAMGMLMKKVGIKESDLDELSLGMKSITKSGISNTGIDKDKLKMGLKDLRKKLDKKKDEAHIVRSKKGVAALRRKGADENPKIRKEAKVNEIVPFLAPAAAAAARVAAPYVAKAVIKYAPKVAKAAKGIVKGTSKGAGNAGKVAGNVVRKYPKSSAGIATGAALSTDAGRKAAGSAVKSLAKKAIGTKAGKVALGVGAAYAAKKAYDKVKSNQAEREAEKRRQAQGKNDA